ncbi:MAG: hypothetical protein ACLQJR_00465 [Stellaceae bacterium]
MRLTKHSSGEEARIVPTTQVGKVAEFLEPPSAANGGATTVTVVLIVLTQLV